VLFAEPGTSATQDFSFFSTTSGQVASESGASFTDNRALNLYTNPVTDSFVSKLSLVTDAGARVSLRCKFDTLPAIGSDGQLISIEGSVFNGFQLGITTDGHLEIRPNGVTAVQGQMVLKVNTVYQICFCYFLTDTTTYRVSVYVNGQQDVSVASGTLSGTGVTDLYLSNRFDLSGANTTNLWLWDIYVDDGTDCSYPGDVRVTSKRPVASGSPANFTTQIGSGGSGYGTGHAPQVNEIPASQTNGWSEVVTGSLVTEKYTVEGKSDGFFDISAYRPVAFIGWIYAKSLVSESANITMTGGFLGGINLTSTPTFFTKIRSATTTYPTGGDDIGIRTATTSTTVSLYECGLFIVVVPAELSARVDEATLGSRVF
jgi:hypothetical protein